MVPAAAPATLPRMVHAPELQSRYVTPAAWAVPMRAHTEALLVEQAHLEKKAAACAVQFLFRIPVAGQSHKALSALAREELVHFERTLRLLQQRGIVFQTRPPCSYAAELKAHCSSRMPERLVDELLVAGVIEARSHERLQLLASALRGVDDELAAFYAELGAAEERHEGIYVEAAAEVLPRTQVDERHRRMLAHEATVLERLPWAVHLHSGCHGGLPSGLDEADAAHG